MKRLMLGIFALAILAGSAIAAPAHDYSGAYLHPRVPADQPALSAAAGQSGSGHSVALAWAASTSAASCSTPCVFGYNVFRGTATGGESPTPLNSAPLTGTTFTDTTVTLGSAPITYFYTVVAVETVSGVTVASGPSNEASATFPGIPTAPASFTATPK